MLEVRAASDDGTVSSRWMVQKPPQLQAGNASDTLANRQTQSSHPAVAGQGKMSIYLTLLLIIVLSKVVQHATDNRH